MYRTSVLAALSVLGAYLAWSSSDTWQDAPFSLDKTSLQRVIECPRGISGAPGGIILLISGTTASGGDEWPGTPYWEYLPYESPGYDICWFNNPSKGLGDAQLSSEYIAYNVPLLAKKSATGNVAFIGHSQGAGVTPQWALSFWPSIRKYVSANIMIAPPFHGILDLPNLCVAWWGMTECFPSFFQMNAGSAFMLAKNKRGGNLVPTTSIWSRVDGVVVPPESAFIDGAENIAVQQHDICGSGATTDHSMSICIVTQLYTAHRLTDGAAHMVVDPAVYALAVDALRNGGRASAARFDATKSCHGFANTTHSQSYFSATADRINNIIAQPNASTTYQASGYSLTAVEPPLKAYVCKQGQATVCGST
ncbi:alpha/beta-hydrolase [Athelia psychrophila]|uniref:Alpha/beta-hydrolase n=1 Tax=Athelia psychrophila TaxID=1759441 RepID=A0A166CJ08_9AGAM|nr:alpha/beta-hydrolase [Fibularhizoctonia sp. CBS 109695]